MFDRSAKKFFFHFKDLVARASSSVSYRDAEQTCSPPAACHKPCLNILDEQLR